jgi:hypothetical protein
MTGKHLPVASQAPLPFRCIGARTLWVWIGHFCKRPFTDALLICKNALSRGLPAKNRPARPSDWLRAGLD